MKKQAIRFKYEELINRYNYGQLSENEKELFLAALELHPDFREEFNFYMKMKEYVLDDSLQKFKGFLSSINHNSVNGNITET